MAPCAAQRWVALPLPDALEEEFEGYVVRSLAFDQEHDSLTVSELAQRTGLPIGTTHRIANELVGERLLNRDGTSYSIGTGLWEAGELSMVSLRFREIALPFLLSLYEVTGENVHLAILDGFDALYVARLVGPRSVPTISPSSNPETCV